MEAFIPNPENITATGHIDRFPYRAFDSSGYSISESGNVPANICVLQGVPMAQTTFSCTIDSTPAVVKPYQETLSQGEVGLDRQRGLLKFHADDVAKPFTLNYTAAYVPLTPQRLGKLEAHLKAVEEGLENVVVTGTANTIAWFDLSGNLVSSAFTVSSGSVDGITALPSLNSIAGHPFVISGPTQANQDLRTTASPTFGNILFTPSSIGDAVGPQNQTITFGPQLKLETSNTTPIVISGSDGVRLQNNGTTRVNVTSTGTIVTGTFSCTGKITGSTGIQVPRGQTLDLWSETPNNMTISVHPTSSNMQFISGGVLAFNIGTGGIYTRGRTTIVNFDSADLDFSVRGLNETNGIYFDATTSITGFGKAPTPGFRIDVEGTARMDQLNITSLPTSDPGVPGQLWRDGTTVKVSLG